MVTEFRTCSLRIWGTTAFVFKTALSGVGMIPFGREICTVKYCIFEEYPHLYYEYICDIT